MDARLLAEHVLGWDATRYFTVGGEAEPPGFSDRYEALVARRTAREPLAYIVGRQEFWGLAFEVSPAVLVPRPETELLVESVLQVCLTGRIRVADVCTGSGCVAVALATEWPAARVTATDISDDALGLARRNAVAHRVADRIAFRQADLLDEIAGPFEVILSNPPYVPDRDRDNIQPEVREYEPALALFAGTDGLVVIRQLIHEAEKRLDKGGFLLFEFGAGQADDVRRLISETSGLRMIALREDLQRIPRVAIAQRS